LTDPLAIFFKDLFDNSSLVDVAPTELVPTWRNGRIGDSSIAKRLDRFFVAEDLIGPAMRYRSWVESPSFLITLLLFYNWILVYRRQLTLLSSIHVWLRDDSFATLASEVWYDARFELVEGAQRRLVEKLSLLKSRVKSWSKAKRIREQEFIKSWKLIWNCFMYRNIKVLSLLI
jgi:hypothetical protein